MVVLPKTQAGPRTEVRGAAESEPSATVLLVDDDPGVCSFVRRALKAEGYGDDALDLATDPLHACGGCGKRESDGVRLRKCTRCSGVVYCGAQCQQSDWARHKQCCSKELALLRRALRRLDTEQPREVDVQMMSPEAGATTFRADEIGRAHV